MLFCHLRLAAPKPPPRGHPRELRSMGDYLRKARLERNLLQEDVARELGVSVATLANWEKRHTRIATRFMPRVLAFLGYEPRGEGGSVGDRIRLKREGLGLSQAELGDRLGLSPSTVTAWERGRVRRRFAKVKRLFESFLQEPLEPASPVSRD